MFFYFLHKVVILLTNSVIERQDGPDPGLRNERHEIDKP